MKTNALYIYLVFVLLVVFFSACVKDTDFDKASDIVLNPVVELDLLYFDLPANRFFDTVANTSILTARDTTAIPFLNDSDIRDNLKKIVFSFRVDNSIQREFLVNFEFLNQLDSLVYASPILVAPGALESPVIIELLDTVEGQDLENLTEAERVAVSVTIASSDNSLDGNINLRSIVTYYLEI
jgi:hypothetical protein